MEPASILLWLAVLNCGAILLHSLVARRWNGFTTVAVFVVLIAVASWLLVRPLAGWISGSVWAVLILLPMLGNRLLIWLVNRNSYRAARGLAHALAYLHPFNDSRNLPQFVKALECMFHGDNRRARELLSPISDDNTDLSTLAHILSYRLEGRWEDLLTWVQKKAEETPLRDPMLIDGYLQALGELGRTHDLVHEYQRLVLQEKRLHETFQTNMIRVRVAAFCGEVEVTRKLLAGPLARGSTGMQQFWLGTALQAAGQTLQAQEVFQRLAKQPDQHLAQRAQFRLDSPLAIASVDRTPEEQRLLDELAQTVGHETHYAVISSVARRPTPVTWLLTLTLLCVFGLEIPGGTTDEQNLFALGALIVPTSVTPGETDRFVLAAFLHYGWLHLVMNVLGLLWFGRRLERAWGSLPMLCCYLITAIGSIVLYPFEIELLQQWGWQSPGVTMLVGASGGVLGLIGGLTGHLLFGVSSGRSAVVTREFGLLAATVGVQTLFDLNTPAVSSLVHTNGLIIGLITGLCVALLIRQRSQLRPSGSDASASPPLEGAFRSTELPK